jgi:hypothetical protein
MADATTPPVGPPGLQQVETTAENFANNVLLQFIWSQLVVAAPWLAMPVVGSFLHWLFNFLGSRLDTAAIQAIGDFYIGANTAAQAAQETQEAQNLASTIDNPGATPDEIAAAQKAFEASLGNVIHFNARPPAI